MERSDSRTSFSSFALQTELMTKAMHRFNKRIQQKRVGQVFLFPGDDELNFLVGHLAEVDDELIQLQAILQLILSERELES